MKLLISSLTANVGHHRLITVMLFMVVSLALTGCGESELESADESDPQTTEKIFDVELHGLALTSQTAAQVRFVSTGNEMTASLDGIQSLGDEQSFITYRLISGVNTASPFGTQRTSYEQPITLSKNNLDELVYLELTDQLGNSTFTEFNREEL